MTSGTKGKPVGIYVRISRDSTRKGEGVARQEKSCRELATKNGWHVVDVFKDNDVSAYSGTRRPAYERLLAAIADGSIKAVVVWHTDRLYRRMADLERYIDVCQPLKVPTYTCNAGDLDLTTPAGRMTARTLGSVAQYEAEQKGERQREANAARALKGRHYTTRRCFGYEPDGVTIRETEAEAIREAVDDLLNKRASLGGIARRWNEAELYPPQGKRRTQAELDAHTEAVEAALAAGEEPPPLPPLKSSRWSSTVVRTTLRTARLTGIKTYKGRQVRVPETGELVETEWPAIIDRATWAVLQKRLDEIADEKRFPSAERQLLSGLAVCGDCGVPIISGGTRNGRRRYRCRTKGSHFYREAEPIDDLIEQLMVKQMKEPRIRELLARMEAPEVDVTGIMNSLDALDARATEMAEVAATGVVSIAQLVAFNSSIAEQRAALESQIPTPKAPGLHRLVEADDVEAAWQALTQDEKRANIDAFMHIEILAPGTKENAYVDWRKRVINPRTVRVTSKLVPSAPKPDTPSTDRP